MALHPDDLSDALDAVERAGHERDSLTIRFESFPRMGCGVGEPPGEVAIRNDSTRIERRYNAGPGAKWLRQFEADVSRQVFWP